MSRIFVPAGRAVDLLGCGYFDDGADAVLLLQGLYKSDGIFCSQCEAEGFRGITFFYDRPDVLAIYTVKVTADKGKYPVLLSNGNLIEEGDAGMGRCAHLLTAIHEVSFSFFTHVQQML